jgi:uncharacterized lipoprotein YddW (UPF0748 family)
MNKITYTKFIGNVITAGHLICLALAILLNGLTRQALASDILPEQGTAFVLNFDKPLAAGIPKNILVEVHGGEIIPGGVSGKALRLNQGEYLVLDLSDKVNSSEGTFMVWVRPHWPSSSPSSHTFLSFTWSGDDQGYFALTRGWWEPAGAKLTYFILNNRAPAHLHKLMDYEENAWTHLACTWKSGNPGYFRIFVNGFKSRGEIKYTSTTVRHASAKLYVGSDQGSNMAHERWADSDIDELAFYQQALTDEQIFSIFQKQKPAIPRSPKKIAGKVLETRAIFDEGVGWATETGARKTIERIKRAGFNVFIPCVWHGQGTRFPSAEAPPEKGFSIITDDPLKRLINIAHQNGIEVHPWFCVALRQKEFFKDFYGPGTPKDAFDLHRPAFRAFISDLIADVVRRYDVYGVNLDYIRTMGLCTCDFCQQEYQKNTGRNLLKDIAHPNRDGTLQPDLQKWQDEAVGTVVRMVKEKSKALKPRLIISVDASPYTLPHPEGREVIRWANAGLVDVIFNMDYSTIPDFETYHMLSDRLKDPGKLIMLLANCQWDRPQKGYKSSAPANLVRMTENIQMRWPGGVGIYLYSLLDDAQIEALARAPFQLPASPSWQIKASK